MSVLFLSLCLCSSHFDVWTHQVIKHPHQRLKLQLANLPFVLSGHADGSHWGQGEHSWFVLLLIQHYQVVHTASTWDGIHLEWQSRDRRRGMWASTADWWLVMQHKTDTKRPLCCQTSVALDHPPKIRIRRLPDYFPRRRKTSFTKIKMRCPSIYSDHSTKEYTVHGTQQTWWGDLFIEIKLGFAGWINVFFCLTGGESIRRFGMTVPAWDATSSLKSSVKVNTKTRKGPPAKQPNKSHTYL